MKKPTDQQTTDAAASSPLPAEVCNAFPKLLSELRDGGAQHEASEKLTELVQSVAETCKPGKLVVTLSIMPAGNGRIMTITDEIVVKAPKADKEATLLFATEEGLLQRDNPQQRNLNFRTLPSDAPAEVKEVVESRAAVKAI